VKPQALKVRIPHRIFHHILFFKVLAAVNFDYYFRGGTIKINNVISNNFLSIELIAF